MKDAKKKRKEKPKQKLKAELCWFIVLAAAVKYANCKYVNANTEIT